MPLSLYHLGPGEAPTTEFVSTPRSPIVIRTSSCSRNFMQANRMPTPEGVQTVGRFADCGLILRRVDVVVVNAPNGLPIERIRSNRECTFRRPVIQNGR